MAKVICQERDCPARAKTRGWCNKHYLRWWKHGHPGFTLIIVGDDARRFHSKVEIGQSSALRPDLGPCWLWRGGLDVGGYGQFSVGPVTCVAHRVAYELFVGPIPPGLHLDHLCRVRACVRPSHLEPVTPAENLRRGLSPTALNAVKTHCPSGHPYTGPNLYVTRQGARQCRECTRRRNRERRSANRA